VVVAVGPEAVDDFVESTPGMKIGKLGVVDAVDDLCIAVGVHPVTGV
jgi:hypothetical protein